MVITKSSGNRNVLFLSTVPPLFATKKDDNKSKPASYKLYDFSKGRADITVQKNGVLQLYIEIKVLDNEYIFVRFELMLSEHWHNKCNEQ